MAVARAAVGTYLTTQGGAPWRGWVDPALAGLLGATLRALLSVSPNRSVSSVAEAVLFVAVVTAIALIVPAWRATQLDPSVVLHVS